MDVEANVSHASIRETFGSPTPNAHWYASNLHEHGLDKARISTCEGSRAVYVASHWLQQKARNKMVPLVYAQSESQCSHRAELFISGALVLACCKGMQ